MINILRIKLIEFHTFYKIWNIFFYIFLYILFLFILLWSIDSFILHNYFFIITHKIFKHSTYFWVFLPALLPVVVFTNLILISIFKERLYNIEGEIIVEIDNISIQTHNNLYHPLENSDFIKFKIYDYYSNQHALRMDFKNYIKFRHNNKIFKYNFFLDSLEQTKQLGKILNTLKAKHNNIILIGSTYFFKESVKEYKGYFTRL